ncbi:MAG: DUF4102 domain-containing protein [Campylobacterales bacterium]|nr:DUF4102 domain-containing protein [Campylobacterales bacterium]
MPKRITPLSDREIKTAKPDSNKKITKLSDGGGLVLLVKQMTNSVSKQWKYNYLFNGKQKTYSIGTYPTITLSQARDKHKELKNLVANGIDPHEQKKEAKLKAKEQKAKIENTFKKVALEWHTSYQSEVSENYHHKLLRMLEIHIFIHEKENQRIEADIQRVRARNDGLRGAIISAKNDESRIRGEIKELEESMKVKVGNTPKAQAEFETKVGYTLKI